MVGGGLHYILGILYVRAGAKERSALSIQPMLDGRTSVEDIDTAMEVEAGRGHAAGGNGLCIALFPLGVIILPICVSVAICAKGFTLLQAWNAGDMSGQPYWAISPE